MNSASKPKIITSEVVATHFRRLAEERANGSALAGERYRQLEIEIVSEQELRITGPDAPIGEFVMDDTAAELGIQVDYHRDANGAVLVLWHII